MLTPLANGRLYTTTAKIEENTILNRGILDVGGFAVPNALMANNKVEGVERITKSSFYLFLAMIAPLGFLPLCNRFFLKKSNIIKNFKDDGAQIIQISNKYLTKDAKTMEKGIEELAEKLQAKEKFKNIKKNFDGILNNFSNKEDLRLELIKNKRRIMTADFLFAGILSGSVPWWINELTAKITGRKGNTAEFEMADKDYVENKAKKHEHNKLKKYLAGLAIMVVTATVLPTIVKKSMLSQNPKNSIAKWIKNNAQKFDYTDGIYIKRLPYFLIELLGGHASWILSSRDKDEARDWLIRFAMIDSVFFGGDLALNNASARYFDKYKNTNLINKEKLKDAKSWHNKLFVPLRTLEELKLAKNTDAKTLKYALGMYWGNFALTMLALGIGLPFLSNIILRNNIQKDLEEINKNNKPNTMQDKMQEFLRSGKLK